MKELIKTEFNSSRRAEEKLEAAFGPTCVVTHLFASPKFQ